MRLPVPQDDEIAARLRADQADPLVMYFVVPRGIKTPLAELAAQAARAAWRCCDELGDDPRYADQFATWFAGSFRKVALRARPAQYETVVDLTAHCAVREGDVLCLVPMARSARPEAFDNLQALTRLDNPDITELVGLPAPAQLVVNAPLGMGAGKVIAQVGHAALMLRAHRGGTAPHFAVNATDEWEQVIAAHDAFVVRDGGITEVEPRAETVLAIV